MRPVELPAVPTPSTRDASVRGRATRRCLAVLVCFTTIGIVNAWPIAKAPATTIGQHGDAFFSVWRLAWIAHQIVNDPIHLFDANIFYPEPTTLAFSDAILLPGLLLAPLHWLGAHPLVVYNVALIACFILNALAAYALVRRLTGSTAAGLLGGLIYGFSPHRFDHFDHFEMQVAFWIPLAVLAWHRAVTDGRLRDHVITGLLAACQVLSSIYYGLFLLTWLGFITVFWHWRRPRVALKAAALILLPALIALALYSVPYLGAREQVGDRNPADIVGYSARPMDFLSSPISNVLYGWTEPLGGPERHLFPGAIVIGLLIAGLWPPFSRVRVLHIGALLFALQLAIGFNGPVYRLLYDWVLPFRGIRVPARADVLILISVAVIAGFGLVRVMSRTGTRGRAALAATLLIAGTGVEYLARPHVQPVDGRISGLYRLLATEKDAIVFEWPVTVPWRLYDMVDVTYMYRSTMHWRPLLNGYSGYYPPSYLDMLLRMRSFPDTGSIAYLQRRGATILVIHERPGRTATYNHAALRLLRDPKIRLIAEGRDDGRRVLFLRLLPED